MRRMLPIALIAFTLCAGFIVRSVAADARLSQAQAGQSAQAVKYAYVLGVNQRAMICFAESTGCRMQEVTADPVMMTVDARRMLDFSATQGAAVAKAVSLLGDAGWEMVGPGPAYANAMAEQALHFKHIAR
jgi:hypothetical protein